MAARPHDRFTMQTRRQFNLDATGRRSRGWKLNPRSLADADHTFKLACEIGSTEVYQHAIITHLATRAVESGAIFPAGPSRFRQVRIERLLPCIFSRFSFRRDRDLPLAMKAK